MRPIQWGSSPADGIIVRRRLLALAALFLSACSTPAAAGQEKRAALVIGNAAYAALPRLAGADEDAAAVAGALERLGFSVTRALNADRRATLAAIAAFRRDAASADAALLFYSGYSLRYRDAASIAPTDAVLRQEADIGRETIDLSQAIDAMPVAGAAFIVIDGCGSAGLAPTLAPFGALATPGLGSPPARAGALSALSAEARDPACAAATRSSLLGRSLAADIEQPGLSAGDLFQRIGRLIARRSAGRQAVLVAGVAAPAFVFAAPGFPDGDFRRLGVAPPAAELRAFAERHPGHPLAARALARAASGGRWRWRPAARLHGRWPARNGAAIVTTGRAPPGSRRSMAAGLARRRTGLRNWPPPRRAARTLRAPSARGSIGKRKPVSSADRRRSAVLRASAPRPTGSRMTNASGFSAPRRSGADSPTRTRTRTKTKTKTRTGAPTPSAQAVRLPAAGQAADEDKRRAAGRPRLWS
ncbi:MAG: caspase family protein [Rhizobiales bacterium]|nr:caspase family protein [Hyphomicrobiales bacterium]